MGDVNQRTQGTEFYGTSSNFALLNQLFASAQQHDPHRYVGSDGHESTSQLLHPSSASHREMPVASRGRQSISGSHDVQTGLTALSQDRVSIIDLLSNEEVLSPPPRPATPARLVNNQRAGRSITVPSQRRLRNGPLGSTLRESSLAVSQSNQPEHIADASIQASKRRLEKAYIHEFFHNLHLLHPMLDPPQFEERCERNIWEMHTTTERHKGSRHFSALYNIVVAVGALIAGRNVLEDLGPDMQICTVELVESGVPERQISSQMISRTYFRKSKDQLGDTSAVCSLESAQTLLLMVRDPSIACYFTC